MTSDLSTADHADLADRARRVIDANKYLTLATVDGVGAPWATPVYFTPEGHVVFRWVSSPDALHSRNLAAGSDAAIAVYDSSVAIGAAEAVFVRADVRIVPDEQLEQAAGQFSGRFDQLRTFTPDHLRAPADLRLYEATARQVWVLVRGGDPRYGRGVDSRIEIDLDVLTG